MRFSIVTVIIASVSVAVAVPTLENRQAICSGTEPDAQCCATNVLGVADLNCNTPPTTPTDIADFISICAAIGQQAQCCLLPIAGQALVCESPE